MLPTTVTLTDGVTPEIFDNQRSTPNGSTYNAPSPQGDLLGRPILRVESTTTPKKVVRGIAGFQRPLWDAVAGKYVYFNSAAIMGTRHASQSRDEFLSDLKKIKSIPDAVLEQLADDSL